MDAGDLHAILLLALPVTTLAALFATKSHKPSSRQVVYSLLIAAIVAAVLNLPHLCFEGNPTRPGIVAGACLAAILLRVADPKLRWALAALVAVFGFGLANHFNNVVHSAGWTGNPAWPGGAQLIFKSDRNAAVATIMSTPELARAELPTGWFRDLPAPPSVLAMFADGTYNRRVIQPQWHSQITGLYQYDAISLDVWYPGGPLGENIGKMELRDRPTTSQPAPDTRLNQ